MASKAAKWFVGLAITAAVIYGTYWVTKQINLYKKSLFQYVGINIKSINWNKIHLVFIFKYANKMDMGFYVMNQVYDVYINGKKVKTLTNNDRLEIPKRGTVNLPIDLQFTPGEATKIGIPNIDALIYDRSKVKIEIKGYLTLGGFGFQWDNLPIDYEDTLKNMIGK